MKVFTCIVVMAALPYLINLPLKDETVNEYLKSVYSTIVFRDVVSRTICGIVPFRKTLFSSYLKILETCFLPKISVTI